MDRTTYLALMDEALKTLRNGAENTPERRAFTDRLEEFLLSDIGWDLMSNTHPEDILYWKFITTNNVHDEYRNQGGVDGISYGDMEMIKSRIEEGMSSSYGMDSDEANAVRRAVGIVLFDDDPAQYE